MKFSGNFNPYYVGLNVPFMNKISIRHVPLYKNLKTK